MRVHCFTGLIKARNVVLYQTYIDPDKFIVKLISMDIKFKYEKLIQNYGTLLRIELDTFTSYYHYILLSITPFINYYLLLSVDLWVTYKKRIKII